MEKIKSTKCPYRSRKCHCSCKAYPESKIASIRSPSQWPLPRPELQTWNKLLAASQLALLHWKQVQFPTQVSADHPLDLSFYLDKLMAPQPRSPVTWASFEEGRNTRRTLDKDTSPDDDNARSVVLLRFPCEQCHAGMSRLAEKDTRSNRSAGKNPMQNRNYASYTRV